MKKSFDSKRKVWTYTEGKRCMEVDKNTLKRLKECCGSLEAVDKEIKDYFKEGDCIESFFS